MRWAGEMECRRKRERRDSCKTRRGRDAEGGKEMENGERERIAHRPACEIAPEITKALM